jgi:hypothetical protein
MFSLHYASVWCDMSILELDEEQWEANAKPDMPHYEEDNAVSDEATYQYTMHKKIEQVNEARLAVADLVRHFKQIAVSTWWHVLSLHLLKLCSEQVIGELWQRDEISANNKNLDAEFNVTADSPSTHAV